MKASCVPSGDQEALASFAGVLVTSTGVPPVASTTKMSYCSMLLPW